MKISEFIKELQSIIDTEGDLDVAWVNTCGFNGLDHIEDIASIKEYCRGGEKYLEITTC